MKKLLLLVYIFFAFIKPQSDQEGISECSISKINKFYNTEAVFYPGDENYDVKYYKLNLNLSWRPDYLTGEVTIAALSNTADLTSVFIDLSNNLRVDSIKMEGNRLNFSHENNIINVEFTEPAGLNEMFTLFIYYQGKPVAENFRGLTFGEHNGKPSIFSLGEPYFVKDWFPCKDTPADKADSADIWLTVRNDLTAVSNGNLIEVSDNGDTKTFKWHNSYPIAHYLISVAISDYTEYLQHFFYENYIMPVTDYIYPDHFEQVKPELDKTIEMLHIFSEMFGEYPFIKEKYGHAEFGWGGGMEHQTISSMGSFNEYIISHELAHQWFGDKITCRDWQNIWLNEGFATYSTGLYFESVYGYEEYKNYINTQMAAAKDAKGSLYVQNIYSVQEIFNGARSYSKGAVVLHMLRGVTGDEIFFNILKTYANHPSVSYGTAVTEDFQMIAESVYGSSLDYFFNQWIYGENFPKYKAGWSTVQVNEEVYRINLLIEQNNNDNPSYFSMPLQVLIKTDIADTTITIFNNSAVQEFEILVRGNPVDLIIDPEKFVMKELLYTNTGSSAFPAEFALQQNFPNPFNSSTVIRFSVPVNQSGVSEVEMFLYDITGRKAAELFNGELSAGDYSIKLNTDDYSLSSGIYIYNLRSAGKFLSRKMLLIK